MLSRRVLLGGAAAAALSGCTLLPAGGGPTLPPPSGPPLPGQEAALALRSALDAAASGALTPQQAALVAWLLDVSDDQLGAVSLPVPTSSVRSPSPSSPPAPATPTLSPAAAPDAAASLVAALVAAAAAFRAQALDAATARPLVWASMYAWASSVATLLPAADAPREPARGVRLPAEQSAAEAAQAALDAAGATLHGLQVAAAAPGVGPSDAVAFGRRLDFWAGLRDYVTAAIRAATATPTPAAPWYAVDRPTAADGARAMAARLQASALPVLGRSLAHGPAALRGVLVDAIADVAADLPRWGGLVERWPGLPR